MQMKSYQDNVLSKLKISSGRGWGGGVTWTISDQDIIVLGHCRTRTLSKLKISVGGGGGGVVTWKQDNRTQMQTNTNAAGKNADARTYERPVIVRQVKQMTLGSVAVIDFVFFTQQRKMEFTCHRRGGEGG